MNKLLLILILTLSFQSWTKADDIKDFEIEGMSIGDSLLDYINLKTINNEKFFNYDSEEMYSLYLYKNLELYDELEINFQNDDNEYRIVAISGVTILNINDCLKKKKIVVKSLKLDFATKPENYTHIYDNNYIEGSSNLSTSLNSESKAYITQWTFASGDKVRVWCSEWGNDVKKLLKWNNELHVKIQEKKWMDFIQRQN